MNIIVTGSTGFVGRNLLPSLLKDGHSILEITRDEEKSLAYFGSQTSKYQITDNQVEFQKIISDFEPEVCIHLASFLTSGDDYTTLQNLLDANVYFLCRLLDALKNTTLKVFVNTGTFAEYQEGNGLLDPAYLYAATKTASRSFLDYYSKAYHFKQLTVVPYTIYGGADTQPKIIDYIYNSIGSKNKIDLSFGTQVLDFVHVSDVIDFYSNIINKHNNLVDKAVYHLGTGKGTTLRELAALIEKYTGNSVEVNWGGKLFRPTDVMYAVADSSNIDFWKPKITIDAGLQLFLKSKKLK